MSKAAKALAKIRNNPKVVRFDEIDRILISLGFKKRQKGSHAFYTLGTLRFGLPQPHATPHVLPVYVKQFLALMDELLDDDDA
jgi:hypothetical protein